jgi:hypothetical protein
MRYWADGSIDMAQGMNLNENLSYMVRIKGSGTKEQFAEIHEAVMRPRPTSTTCRGPWPSNRHSS